MHRARVVCWNRGTSIWWTGYKDVIAMHAAGITNCVGICGTERRRSRSVFLAEVDHVFLVMDGDEPGRKRLLNNPGEAGA